MRLLAMLRQERDALDAEEDQIIASAEAAGTFTDEQRERRAAIATRRGQLASDITSLEQREARIQSAPAIGGDLLPVAAQPTEAPKPFADFGDYLAAVRQSTINAKRGAASADPRLLAIQAAATGLNETVGSDGGFAVQTDFADRILSRVYEDAVLWPRAFPIPLGANSNGVKINLLDETSRVTGSRFGGVQVYWEPEATAATAKKPKIFPLELNLQKLIGLGYRTGEIATDWTASGAILEATFSAEMAFTLDDAALRGTGAGQPLGVLNSSALVTVAKEAGQDADSLVAANIDKMFARMAPRSLGSAVWYINQALWPQVFALARVIGTGGVPLFIPSGGLGSAPGGAILGRPVVALEQCSAPGDVGDVVFADYGEYLRLEKGGVQRASSIHVEFLTDQEVFRWILRTNGAPGWKSAVTPYKGSDTVSPFVTLAAR